MRQPEILAPAGSWDGLVAALRCGADAVYAGGKLFSARHSAENFTMAQLQEAVDLCHLYGAKLYLTVNTLVMNEELPKLTQFLQEAVQCGVDAVLVQDMGVLTLLRQMAPDTPVHASTQMTIHTPAGAKWAKAQGIARVVVARELSRSEIAVICQCGVEVEQFVHGALCMSVSGQCGLSAVIGSRSANRGRCAQACRLPFSAAGNRDACALSLKDLCLVPYMQEMKEDGIASLKIEGRCKRPEYVAAAVTALVQARNGETPDLDVLQSVFSRSGFTDGYYTGVRRNMFGVRRKEDVVRAKAVLPQLAQCYRKPLGKIPLVFHAVIETGAPAQLTATDIDGNRVTVTGELVQPAQHKATDVAQLQRQLGKLGGTVYILQSVDGICDGVGMLSASALNQLRRDCVLAMDHARICANTPKKTWIPFDMIRQAESCTSKPRRYRVQLPRWQQDLAAFLQEDDTEAVLLPAGSDLTAVPEKLHSQIYLTLPRFCAKEEIITAWLTQAKKQGFSHVICENVAHIYLAEQIGMICHGGMGLNITNSYSLAFFQKQGLVDAMLSPELTAAQSRSCHGLPIGLYAYGNQPVMTMRNCPIQGEIGCGSCQHRLTDRTGRQFPVFCDKTVGVTTMYNAVPTWMADKQNQLAHADFLLLDCTLGQDPFTVRNAYRTEQITEKPMTRGLFFRGVTESLHS